MQLKSAHLHDITRFIKNSSQPKLGWIYELGSTLVAVSSKVFAVTVAEAGFPTRQLFIELVWKWGSGGCILMNYSGQ